MREYLERLRIEKGMAKQEMAKKLDVSLSYYCQIEKGDRQQNMSLQLMKKISSALNVPMGYIIEEETTLMNSLHNG